ncbi:class V chitinase CHIT5a-like [Bidens hawaiensis]|uniref:class V chitinase CHIT5a-like n=1 Tax=Bidens hawaiensis TaxID=980011 RepID=UPI00404AD534
MASSQNSRGTFIRSTIQMARKYNFDGVDIDWEYPQTQTAIDNFGLLLDEWRVAVNQEAKSTGKPQLLLSAATNYKAVVDGGPKYPVESIKRNLDWINAMCYDYHGPWTPSATGTLAALYDPNGHVSTSDGLQSWINAGIQKEKLVMGLPLFGRTWKLQNPSVNGIGAPAVGIGPGNEGAMLYSEVQQFNTKNKAKVVYDTSTVSYYSVAGTSWIGYDDVSSVQKKVEYARSLNIGGYFLWTVVGDQDWKISRLASKTWTS